MAEDDLCDDSAPRYRYHLSDDDTKKRHSNVVEKRKYSIRIQLEQASKVVY